MEWRKELGRGFHGSAQFAGFSWKKRGKLWRWFWHLFHFWLECWLFVNLVLNLSTELPIFASAGSKQEAFFLASLYNDLWPYILNIMSEHGHDTPGFHVCLSEYTFQCPGAYSLTPQALNWAGQDKLKRASTCLSLLLKRPHPVPTHVVMPTVPCSRSCGNGPNL